MKVVNKVVRILVVYLVIEEVRCQDGYTDLSNAQMKQIGSNEEQVKAITSYDTNDAQSQSISPANMQYHIVDDSNQISNYNRAERGRTRKIFRIKNPFHQPDEDDNKKQNLKTNSHDSETGASNHYATMQYSLPPENFLRQLRAENRYNHQQQQISTPAPILGYTATPLPQYQYSTISTTNNNNGNQQNNLTPAPTLGYTATPQPQYQYSTISTNHNNGNLQNNLTPQVESRSPTQFYNPNLNTYQYNNAYSLGIDAIQSTPSSVTLYLSTSSPNNQYSGMPSNNYISSSSPMYLSSPSNLPSYISSTLANVQTGSPTYGNINRYSTTVESDTFNYGGINRDNSQNINVNHYDNSANGIKFPLDTQQQFQNDLPSSTHTPLSSIYPDTNHNNWQNSARLSNLPNLRQELSQTFQQNFQNNQQETQQNFNLDNTSTDTHRTGSMPSANNLFLSFIQPDYQTYTAIKKRERDIEQQNTQQTDVYSHGDFGWKLDGKKPLVNYDVTLSPNYSTNQQSNNYQADSTSLSPTYRYVDNMKGYDYDQPSKYKSEKIEAQEFAKAAAKAQENMNRQQNAYLNNYSSHLRYPQNILSGLESTNTFFRTDDNNQKGLIYDNSKAYGNGPSDLVTASPYYFPSSRESILDSKVKEPFDHDKVLQNIVKVDVSKIIPNIDLQTNAVTEANIKYNTSYYNKGLNEQNFKHIVKPVSETYYNDKNTIYGYNIKTKAEDVTSDGSKRLQTSFEHPKKFESSFNLNSLTHNKPQTDVNLQSYQYFTQTNSDNMQTQMQQSEQHPQNPVSSESDRLKLNDIPYWLTQSLNNIHLTQLQNGLNQGIITTGRPLVLNQNIDSHQIDVAASILNKLLRDKQMEINSKLEYDTNKETSLPTINGLKVVNPYNLDLKLVAEILKGRTNDINLLRNQFNQPIPGRWDTSQLQHFMLKNDNTGQYTVINDGLGSASSPFFEIHNSGRNPYQGVKYSRSQEEEENLIPITGSTQIGAVIEEDEFRNQYRELVDSDETGSNNDEVTVEIDEEKPKMPSRQRMISRHRNPNSLISSRHFFQRKNPKIIVEEQEPYPLLKPPPVHSIKGRNRNKFDNRRQRGNKLKFSRIVKREPVLEEENFTDDLHVTVPTVLKPPPEAENKSDILESSE